MSVYLLNEPRRESIQLETSKKTVIDNYQIFEISDFEKNQYKKYSPDNYPNVTFRNCPSPKYNCHGMTFASRRTNIDLSNDIRKILTDDEYYEIEIRETLPGDIILYIDEESGDISHSGTLVNCRHGASDISVLYVVSKWGKYKEVIHQYSDCPYNLLKKVFYRLIHKDYER